jgi:uncharacterized membrane protein
MAKRSTRSPKSSCAVKAESRRRLTFSLTQITLGVKRHEWLPVVALLLLSLSLASYRLAQTPLWLDEVYAFQVSQLELPSLVANSSAEPHPPFYYLLLGLSHGFGRLHSEWGVRWLSVVCAVAMVLLSYALARRVGVAVPYATLGSALLALNPAVVFYSQEARSTVLVLLLGAWSALLLLQLVERPAAVGRWLAYGAAALAGMYANYLFILVVSVQLLYLLLVIRPRWHVLVAGASLGLLYTPMLFWLVSTIGAARDKQGVPQGMTAFELAQSLLGGDPVRYGFHWNHALLVALLGTIALLGLLCGLRRQWNGPVLYLGLHVLLPFVIYILLLAPLLRTQLPLRQAKHFVGILPVFFVLVALGMQQLVSWAQHLTQPASRNGLLLVANLLLGAVLVAQGSAIYRYYSTDRSPESRVVLALRGQLQPDDAVVSGHYTMDAMLSFYTNAPHTYTKPQARSDGFYFARSLTLVAAVFDGIFDTSAAEIARQHRRIWLFEQATADYSLATSFAQWCKVEQQQQIGTHRAILFGNCQP